MSMTETGVGHDSPTWNEIGAALPQSSYNQILVSDYNSDLIGVRAIQTYDRMRRGDSSCRTSLRVVKAPLLAAQWYFEPASNSDDDRLIADFITWAWDNMTRTSQQVLWEALLMCDFGYYAFEKVFTMGKWRPDNERARQKDVVMWQKLAPRHPLLTTGWDFDKNGGVQAIRQNKNPNGFEEVPIPIKKLLIFTMDEEGGNPEGISLLRSAYPHWYYKTNLYKVDAIQKERHGIGVPRVKLPPNATPEDKRLARELVKNLRTNEKAGVVQPAGWEDIDFIEPKGQPVDVLRSAMHHDTMIKANVLAQFLSLGTQESGSRAVGSTQEDIFTKSIHYVADIVCGVLNKWAIPELVNYNFPDVEQYPTMKVRRIGDTTDLRAFSVALRNFIESNAITPDPELETWLRDFTDFPIPSKEAMDRTVKDRTEKKPSQITGAAVADRVPKPADGA